MCINYNKLEKSHVHFILLSLLFSTNSSYLAVIKASLTTHSYAPTDFSISIHSDWLVHQLI